MHDPAIEPLSRLWEQMSALYGAIWIRSNGASPKRHDGEISVAGDTWRRALTGLRGSQIARGLQACVEQGGEYPPSAPRFRAMCLGIPTFVQVQAELREPSAASDFTRAVWSFVDGHAYRMANADKAAQLLRGAYDLAHDRAMRGEPLPSAVIAGTLPKPEAEEPQGIPRKGDTSDAARRVRENHLLALLGELYTPPERRAHVPDR